MQVYMKLKTAQKPFQKLVRPFTVAPDRITKNRSKQTKYLPNKLPGISIQLRIARLSACGSHVMGPIRNEKANLATLWMRRFGCRQCVSI